MENIKKATASKGSRENNQDYDTIAIRLLSILSPEPQTRTELKMRLHVSDRHLRQAVEDLRMQGVPICSSSHGKGYWLGDEADVEQTVIEYRARAKKIAKIADAMENRED